VRKKNNGGSRHFRGRSADRGVRNMSLVDVPIMDMLEIQPLRASAAEKTPQ